MSSYPYEGKKRTIDLLRHGDTGGAKLLGVTDEPLSELGLQQMKAVHVNKELKWEKIVSSPLVRCQSFAQALSSTLSLELQLEAGFEEINFGQWDGQLLTDLYTGVQSEQVKRFMLSPDSESPPGGESYDHFRQRVMTAWQALLDSLYEEDITHCLLVTHAGVIRTIISDILGIPNTSLFKLEVPHACLTRIKQYERYSPVLHFHNGNLYQ